MGIVYPATWTPCDYVVVNNFWSLARRSEKTGGLFVGVFPFFHRLNLAVLFFSFLLVPSTSFASIDVNLQFGSKGSVVVELQNILIAKGYLKGGATGNYFTLTKNAVVAFQTANGLPATGYVGPLTRAKLNAAVTSQGGSMSATASSAPPSAPAPSPSLISHTPFIIMKNYYGFATAAGNSFHATDTPPVSDFISATQVPTQEVNPQAVVLVRCYFKPSFPGNPSQNVGGPAISIGSGVVVSPDGYILTAEHVVRTKELELNDTNAYGDPMNRVWTRQFCQIAPTDSKLTAINGATDFSTILASSSSQFLSADVVFEPTDAEYNSRHFQDVDNPNSTITPGGGADMDFALLKVSGANLPYVPLINKLVALSPGEKMIGLGYPGNEINAPQNLERFDGEFVGIAWQQDSSCMTKTIINQCGVSYETNRYKAHYSSLYYKQTTLGQYTPYFRGGFSGGPLFYHGYVAGLMDYAQENAYSNLYDLSYQGQWNWSESLSSSEVIATLAKHGISLPVVP